MWWAEGHGHLCAAGVLGVSSGGVRIHAGAPVIEHGMVEEDFKDLAAAGVTMLGEVGLGSVKDGATARQMVAWARKVRDSKHHSHRRPFDSGFQPDR